MKQIILIPIVLLLLVSCADHAEKRELAKATSAALPAKLVAEESDEIAGNEVSAVSMNVSHSPVQIKESMVVKTARFRFQVEEVSKSTSTVHAIASQYGAFVADMNLVNSQTEISNHFVIKVPANNFETLLEALGKEATFVDSKEIKTDDVTEEFVDIETRLKTKKQVRDRYLDILKNKAKTVEDVLKAEDQIRVLQEEIEAKEGRLNYLRNRVSLSTIHLEIYQKVEYHAAPDILREAYSAKMSAGFSTGWEILKGIFLGLITIWPLLVMGTVAIIWIRVRKKID